MWSIALSQNVIVFDVNDGDAGTVSKKSKPIGLSLTSELCEPGRDVIRQVPLLSDNISERFRACPELQTDAGLDSNGVPPGNVS